MYLTYEHIYGIDSIVEENDIVRYNGELAVIKKVFDDGDVGILPQMEKVASSAVEVVWKRDDKVLFRGHLYDRVKTFAERDSVWLTLRNPTTRHISIRNKHLGR